MNHGLKKSVLLSLAVLMVVLLVPPAAATEVTRALPSSVSSGASFEVTLTVEGIDAGGIIEEIPEEFAFVGTTHPDTQTEVMGQKVIFSVVGEETITYTVKAPGSGKGLFTGLWDNVVEHTDGRIADGAVNVYSSSSGGGEWGSDAAATTITVPAENRTLTTGSVSERVFTFEGQVFRSITLAAKGNLSGSTLAIAPHILSGEIPAVRGVAYGYYAAELGGPEKNLSVTGATVVFAVDPAWIEEHNISEASIALAGYDPTDGWMLLPTTLRESGDEQMIFEAEAGSLPLFAITGTKRPAGAEPVGTPVTIAAPAAAAEKETLPPSGAGDDGGMIPLVGLLGVLVVVAGLGAYAMMKKKGGDEK